MPGSVAVRTARGSANRPVRWVCVALTLLALVPVWAQAQTCLAFASLDQVKANLVGEYQSAEGITSAGAGIQFRVGKRGFLSGGYARSMADEADAGSNRFSVGAGLEHTPRDAGGWHLCPVLGFQHEASDAIEFLGSRLSASASIMTGGLAVGRVRGDAAALAFAPFALLQGVIARASVDFGGFSFTESQEFLLLQAGVGLLFSDVVSFRPSVMLPIGLGEADPRLALTVGIGVGRR